MGSSPQHGALHEPELRLAPVQTAEPELVSAEHVSAERVSAELVSVEHVSDEAVSAEPELEAQRGDAVVLRPTCWLASYPCDPAPALHTHSDT